MRRALCIDCEGAGKNILCLIVKRLEMVDANVSLRSMKIVMPSVWPACLSSGKKCTECGGRLREERADVGHERCSECEAKAQRGKACCCVVS